MTEPAAVEHVRSFDGTLIRYQSFGAGPTILVGNGIGVGWRGLDLQIAHLSRQFRVVCWDHRGIFGSEPPGDGGVSMPAQARDALCVLDAVSDGRPSYLGWSMGVQVGLEMLRQRPGAFQAVACIGGVAGSPFVTGLPLGPLAPAVAPLLGGLARLGALYGPLVSRVVASDAFGRGAQALGYLRPEADFERFMAMARGVAGHDPTIYLRTLAELARHDAEEVLASIDVPVMFVAGELDLMTPRREIERLAALVRGGRAHCVPRTTHFVTIEAPAEVNRLLEGFFVAALSR